MSYVFTTPWHFFKLLALQESLLFWQQSLDPTTLPSFTLYLFEYWGFYKDINQWDQTTMVGAEIPLKSNSVHPWISIGHLGKADWRWDEQSGVPRRGLNPWHWPPKISFFHVTDTLIRLWWWFLIQEQNVSALLLDILLYANTEEGNRKWLHKT